MYASNTLVKLIQRISRQTNTTPTVVKMVRISVYSVLLIEEKIAQKSIVAAIGVGSVIEVEDCMEQKNSLFKRKL